MNLGIKDFFSLLKQKTSANDTYQDSHNAKSYNLVTSKKVNNILPDIEPELIPLLWFGDGAHKNYFHPCKHMERVTINGFLMEFSTYGTEEPSLIYTKLPIEKPINEADVPRPPYFPSYKELSPEQRWLYWKFLEDPYSGTHDIGYVFIFYYGLERFLFSEHSEKAFNVILKLRDCYANKSFQSYSGTALILYSIVKRDITFANTFLDSLDKKHELKIPANLFILLKYSLALPLTPFEVMHYAKDFSFNNQHYIKDNPEIFLGFLQEGIKKKYNSSSVPLSELFADANMDNITPIEIPLFANISIINKIVRIPCLIDYVPFYSEMYGLLREAHENTKKYLAQLRKNNPKTRNTELSVKQ